MNRERICATIVKDVVPRVPHLLYLTQYQHIAVPRATSSVFNTIPIRCTKPAQASASQTIVKDVPRHVPHLLYLTQFQFVARSPRKHLQTK
jgi:hypothetical protein